MRSLTGRCSVAIVVGAALVFSACGSSGRANNVSTAQKRVDAKTTAVADAQTALDQANEAFCQDTRSYITAIDRYGKLFDQSAATVGDLKTAGADLEQPRAAVTSSVQAVQSARTALSTTKQDLADAQASLAAAQAAASGVTTSQPPATSSTTTTTLVPPATIERVKQAETDLTAASQGITDQTPLLRATTAYNSAAFALEVAWLRLLADASCLTSEQQKQAETALTNYTVALQTALQTTGYYTGKVDGIYGPSTVDAVKKLQTAHGLPATGFVDRATSLALSNAVLAKGGAAASRAFAQAASVQAVLKLAGYWTGPVDGHWTPELTQALKNFQTHLGVPATGQVDTTTLAALQNVIAAAKTPPPTTPPTQQPTTTTTSRPTTPTT
jgi:peptidoglycan hydrolase-like protein with peptidoglycan-binding domain